MIWLVKVQVCDSPCYANCFAVLRFNKGLKRQTHDMLAVQAGDLVLEVNRVVVSPVTVDRVSTVHDAKDLNNQIHLVCLRWNRMQIIVQITMFHFILGCCSSDSSTKRDHTNHNRTKPKWTSSQAQTVQTTQCWFRQWFRREKLP